MNVLTLIISVLMCGDTVTAAGGTKRLLKTSAGRGYDETLKEEQMCQWKSIY